MSIQSKRRSSPCTRPGARAFGLACLLYVMEPLNKSIQDLPEGGKTKTKFPFPAQRQYPAGIAFGGTSLCRKEGLTHQTFLMKPLNRFVQACSAQSRHAALLTVLFFMLQLTACSSSMSSSSQLKLSSDLSPRPLQTSVYLPPSEAPHPVVIDLHGCNGVWNQRQRHWLGRLSRAGFAVIKVDSFSGRGVDNVCGQPFAVSPYTRTFDVAAAIAMAEKDPRFDAQAIFLLGSSHGATSALMTNLYSTPVFAKLRGVVAYYPYCPARLPVLNADLLIVIGDADDWTPAHLCRDMQVINRAGHHYELIVYPGAYHSFDIPGVNNLYYGHQVRYNRLAAEDSMRRTLDFMRLRANLQ